jgi:galactitol-specific phosphotransferase system IIB component
MIKKGEQAMDAVKETGGNIKNDIKREVEDLKCMVAAINEDSDEKEQSVKSEDLFATSTTAADSADTAKKADDTDTTSAQSGTTRTDI